MQGPYEVWRLHDGKRVLGVKAKHAGEPVEYRAAAVILACGGFEANPEWRTRYLGPGWELAKVRGTRFNTGDAIRMALDVGGAAPGSMPFGVSEIHAEGLQIPPVRLFKRWRMESRSWKVRS